MDRTADFLREGIRSGHWLGKLPGSHKLAKELGVSRTTVALAVSRLVADGLLIGAGEREAFRIATRPPGSGRRRTSRPRHPAMLVMKELSKLPPFPQREVLDAVTELKSIGLDCPVFTLPAGKESSTEHRLQRLVGEAAADGWIVHAGSREVLEWFAARRLPALALCGICKNLPIAAAAGSDSAEVVRDTVRRLVALGHRRIVLIAERAHRHAEPARMVKVLKEELAAAGIKPGEYNIPEWDDTPEGLRHLMESLFRLTPPTAFIVFDQSATAGVIGYLVRNGLRVPEDISVVAGDAPEPLLEWTFPEIRCAHFVEDGDAIRRRVREWAEDFVAGKNDLRQVWAASKFIGGNTVGPAKAR